MKLVPPNRSGHVVVPSAVGRWFGSSIGRPLPAISFAHVVLMNGFALMY